MRALAMLTILVSAGGLVAATLWLGGPPRLQSTEAQLMEFQTARPNNVKSLLEGRRFYRGSEFMEFRADGTVFLSLGGSPAHYALEGNVVVISTSFAGAARGTVANAPAITFAAGGSTAQQGLAGVWRPR